MKQTQKKSNGFTLIEIMIVLVIVSILAAIAFPSYRSSVLKSHRTDAKETLLSAAALEEKIYMQRNRYSVSLDDIGGAISSEGHYSISVSQTTLTRYLITATAIGPQVDDTSCYVFTINQAGLRKAQDSNGNEVTDCW
ncbi:type IV pilin protein [Teredinibacter haidensis]|uniref:type IV pilin protein n=1 Tax=Teredinibacter haidensis TaxID=2731755 RepID=UPI000948A0E0|nr:type IV pilin protein [Teredinibacter haidensis]